MIHILVNKRSYEPISPYYWESEGAAAGYIQQEYTRKAAKDITIATFRLAPKSEIS